MLWAVEKGVSEAVECVHKKSDRQTPAGGPWSSHDLTQSSPQSHRRRGGRRDKACEQKTGKDAHVGSEYDGPKPGQTQLCVKVMHKQTWAQWNRSRPGTGVGGCHEHVVMRSQTRRALGGSASVAFGRGTLIYRDGSQSRAPLRRGLVLGDEKMFRVLGNTV